MGRWIYPSRANPYPVGKTSRRCREWGGVDPYTQLGVSPVQKDLPGRWRVLPPGPLARPPSSQVHLPG